MFKGKIVVLKSLLIVLLCFSTIIVSDAFSYTTVEAAVKSPTLEESKATLYVGYEPYTIKILNTNSSAEIIYKSSNTSVATVSSKGVVKPIAAASADISVTIKQNKKTYHLVFKATVKKPYVQLITSTSYMNAGEKYSFKAKAIGTDQKITWSTSDQKVATVSANGSVKAVSGGAVTITASAGKLKATCELNVGTNRISTLSDDIIINDEITIYVTLNDYLEDESLSLVTSGENHIQCDWEKEWDNNSIGLKITPVSTGEETIMITSDKTADFLMIYVTVTENENKKLDSETINEKCTPSVVEITAISGDDSAIGSGFFIGNDMIITNYHVIEGAEQIAVKTADGSKYKINTILGYDEAIDIAVLELKLDLEGLSLSQSKVKGGQKVYTFGSPYGLTGTMTQGMISTASRDIGNGVDYIQIDAAISSGNSGGPLVNEYGEVIGINTMYYVGGQNLNFSININELQKVKINHPMTLAEYKELYKKQWWEKFYSNMVHEDSTLSNSIQYCQEVANEQGVDGILSSSDSQDYYWFEMKEAGWFSAYIRYANEDDMKKVNFDVYINYDDGWRALEDTTDPFEYLQKSLKAGEYLLVINFADDVVKTDVHYFFVTFQNYEE